VLISIKSRFIAAAALLPLLLMGGYPLRAQPSAATGSGQQPPSDADILLSLFQKKGLITDQEAHEARAMLAARQESRWKRRSRRSARFLTP
jgi:hypothetical protein